MAVGFLIGACVVGVLVDGWFVGLGVGLFKGLLDGELDVGWLVGFAVEG